MPPVWHEPCQPPSSAAPRVCGRFGAPPGRSDPARFAGLRGSPTRSEPSVRRLPRQTGETALARRMLKRGRHRPGRARPAYAARSRIPNARSALFPRVRRAWAAVRGAGAAGGGPRLAVRDAARRHPRCRAGFRRRCGERTEPATPIAGLAWRAPASAQDEPSRPTRTGGTAGVAPAAARGNLAECRRQTGRGGGFGRRPRRPRRSSPHASSSRPRQNRTGRRRRKAPRQPWRCPVATTARSPLRRSRRPPARRPRRVLWNLPARSRPAQRTSRRRSHRRRRTRLRRRCRRPGPSGGWPRMRGQPCGRRPSTAPTGGQDAATPPTQAVPPERHRFVQPRRPRRRYGCRNRTGQAEAALSGAAALATPEHRPNPTARGGASGIRQASSLAAVTEPAGASPPASVAAQVAPPSRAPARRPRRARRTIRRTAWATPPGAANRSRRRAGPGAAGRADQTVAAWATGRARADATAPTSSAPRRGRRRAWPGSGGAGRFRRGVHHRDRIGHRGPAHRDRDRTGGSDPRRADRAVAACRRRPTGRARPGVARRRPGHPAGDGSARPGRNSGACRSGSSQPKDGPAQVTVTAERPQTLDLLVRDQARLSRALDQAGVRAEGRSVDLPSRRCRPPARPRTRRAAPRSRPRRARSPPATGRQRRPPGIGPGRAARRLRRRPAAPGRRRERTGRRHPSRGALAARRHRHHGLKETPP